MKTIALFIITALALLAATTASYAQGTVDFSTITVSYASGGPASPGPINGSGHLSVDGFDFGGFYARAGLYYGTPSTPESGMVLGIPVVGFSSDPNPGHPLLGSRTIPGIPQGSTALLQLRVWDAGTTASTYEEAVARITPSQGVYLGASPVLSITLGGPTPPTPTLLLQDFSITWVPEPSILSLTLLGGLGALVLLRRRI